MLFDPNRMRLLASYLRGSSVCPGLPPTGIIATTHRCNMSCRMCIRTTRSFAGPDLEFGLFEKIVDEWIPHLRYISMDGPGETLLNAAAFDMIRYAKSRQVKIMFSTNASLLDGQMTDAIIDSGLDLIIFSVNGATPEIYKTVHGRDCYQDTVAKIHRFLDRKRARHSKIAVALQMIRLPETLPQVKVFYRKWRQVPGVDIVRVKKDVVRTGAAPNKSGRSAARRNPCSRLWHGPVYVEPDGDVYASPGVLFRAAPIGNLKEQPLSEIWNSDRMQAIRRAHISGNVAGFPECVACRYPRPRLPLILAGFLMDPFLTGKLIPLTEKLAFRHHIPLYEGP